MGSQMDSPVVQSLITAIVELKVTKSRTTAGVKAIKVNQEEMNARMEGSQERMDTLRP
jgi:hypothetical protein